MDVFGTPLNFAHQKGRRAESLEQAERFEEAIECHKQAADHLAEAMVQTDVPTALESLSLQRKAHIQAISLLRLKQQHAQRNASTSTEPSPMAAPQFQYHASVSPTDSGTVNGDSVSASTNQNGASVTRLDDDTVVYQTMVECDSLLQFVNKRQGAEQTRSTDTKEILGDHKRPKGDKEIIEELTIYNKSLCVQVQRLLQEVEHKQSVIDTYVEENRRLQSQLWKRDNLLDEEEEERPFRPPSKMNLDELPQMELPPLEVPQFDFSSLQLTSDTTPSLPFSSDPAESTNGV